jgi:FlaA1/EpsC-like NDP-sugar epimerase
MSEFGDLSITKRVLVTGAGGLVGHHFVSTYGWIESELKTAGRMPESAN